jgi:hypothetical protein
VGPNSNIRAAADLPCPHPTSTASPYRSIPASPMQQSMPSTCLNPHPPIPPHHDRHHRSSALFDFASPPRSAVPASVSPALRWPPILVSRSGISACAIRSGVPLILFSLSVCPVSPSASHPLLCRSWTWVSSSLHWLLNCPSQAELQMFSAGSGSPKLFSPSSAPSHPALRMNWFLSLLGEPVDSARFSRNYRSFEESHLSRDILPHCTAISPQFTRAPLRYSYFIQTPAIERLRTEHDLPSPGWLFYECSGGSLCGGLADRFKGIVNTLLLALLTQRGFGVDFSSPLPIQEFLEPAVLEWLDSAPASADSDPLLDRPFPPPYPRSPAYSAPFPPRPLFASNLT